MKRRTLIWCLLLQVMPSFASAGQSDGRLDIYFIDVEGGAATLIVTPTNESILVDTGNPGQRDSIRIHEATKLAGISQIDHLIITHYHGDHFGGAVDLVKLIPFKTIYDNADENPSRDRPTPAYLAIPSENKRVMPTPGDEMPLKQPKDLPLKLKFVAARKKVIDAPPGAKENPFCKDVKGKALDLSDNANSIAFVLSFGEFKFFDAGDLTWNIEHDLACPVNRVGTVDVYQVTHHGLAQSNNPALVKALMPTVAIMNNGATKGCEPEVFTTLKSTETIQAIFQLHKNLRRDGDVNNTSDEHIANMERNCSGNYIKLSVAPDGTTYTVSIPATKVEKQFHTRLPQ
jgi:beta-lactamase superfamily II metal-dependent hydrolase